MALGDEEADIAAADDDDPARRTPLYRWSSADRYVQCRDKLWESPSAEEIDPAKAERCADPNCGNTCQKNHCQKVTTRREFGAIL